MNDLLKLIQENPNLEIKAMVNTECVGGDDYSWWLAEFGSAKIDYYWDSEKYERVFIKSEDEEYLIDEWFDKNVEEDEYKYIFGEELEEIAKADINKYGWKKAILVRIYI